ncbi:GMC oxidoreductase [Alloyangia pacifica]|uniref:GMC oxidoreductase n=1 Tax=Alloyangia pacifica TaxID=311180 RepID=UPI001CFD9B06|nr:GMC oxidoreductase [Alloyangia pacifica]
MTTRAADVVIVGSGPTGSTYARIIRRDWPEARILMVEAGPKTTPEIGKHLDNLPDAARTEAQLLAQGPKRGVAYAPITRAEWEARKAGRHDASLQRRPGLFFANTDTPDETAFAGFAAASVGGMGVQWTSGCPHPSKSERVPFIDEAEMEAALQLADELLGANKHPFPGCKGSEEMRRRLGEVFNPGRPEDRKVQPMPLAYTVTEDGVITHGTDHILGEMVNEPEEMFRILPETACRRVLHENGIATGVELVSMTSGESWQVEAGTVVVAADSLHGPQLLYGSGIRPEALGRNINDHYLINRFFITDIEGPLTSMSWIPRVDNEDFPFSVTIHGNDPANFPFPEKVEGNLVGMGLFVAADPRPENRIIFDEDTPDWKGLPSFSIHAPINEVDETRIEMGKAVAEKIATTLGTLLDGFATTRIPTGNSLHYQGTLRMGETDDGTSVCDRYSRVWGFENLHVAGNGIIPTVTATNPTPFIVALASMGARKIAEARRTVAEAAA